MKAGAFLLAALLFGACGVGDDGGGPTPPDPNPLRIKCSSAIRVTGTFTESTVHPRPTDPLGPDGEAGTADDNTTKQGGCWPVGTWTFTASEDTTADVRDIDGDGLGDRCGQVAGTTGPTFEASYSFSVDRNEDPTQDGLVETYMYLGSSPGFVDVKVAAGGNGDCEGIMEFKSSDSKSWWTLNPEICTSDACAPPSTTVTGTGDFTVYLDPQ